MHPAWIIVIYLVGLIAMVVEMFLPGAVLGIAGLIAVTGAIIYAYASGHPIMGTIMLGTTIAMVPVFFLTWRSVLGRYWALKDTVKGRSFADMEDLLGKEGEAVSQLRPSGVALIDGKRRSVVTRGEMLEKGTAVKVIEVTGSRIVVKKT